MAISLNIGYNKSESQDFLNHVMLGLLIKAIMDYEKLPADKRGLKDEKEYWYRQAMQNLTVKFSPWALFNHYRKYLSTYQTSPFIMSFSKAVQNTKTAGNDRPYTISEAEKLYGGGWVKYVNHWTEANTFGQGFKPAVTVVGGIVTGALAGGPVGAVIGAIGGAAKYKADSELAKGVAKIEAAKEVTAAQEQLLLANQKVTEQENTANLAAGLLSFKGPQLWVLSILILAGLYLMFKK